MHAEDIFLNYHMIVNDFLNFMTARYIKKIRIFMPVLLKYCRYLFNYQIYSIDNIINDTIFTAQYFHFDY